MSEVGIHGDEIFKLFAFQFHHDILVSVMSKYTVATS